MIPPRATMRLQLHHGFTFDDAARQTDYLAALGISHLYSSPILTARRGSLHCYDVTDPTEVNPELGGETGFRRLVTALRANGLGLIVDIVPNHMAIGHENAWWWDVLRLGEASRYAATFDIDWHPDNPALAGKVLLPVLGKQYGQALAAGEIRLVRGRDRWEACYFDDKFPIAPEDHAEIERHSAAAYDPADAEGRTRLHRLLERQHYRLAWWRTAGDEINWRRFFDINELIGVRVDDPEVFEATHPTLFRLYADGLIDGVRVDHVDGLSDPGAYCRRLRARLAKLAPEHEPYILVEKILGAGEALAEDWGVNGTSGYHFMDSVSAVQHDPAAQDALSELWATLSGRPGAFKSEETAARREIIEHAFSAQLEATVGALHSVALSDPATRDASRAALRRALIELLAHFPAYRNYPSDGEPPRPESALFERAAAQARNAGRLVTTDVLDLVVGWLRTPVSPAQRHAARRFQQLSAPVAAKAVEDTAFYRYGRLLSRNDVGFDAERLGSEPAEFHQLCATRRARFPDAMLATATHDHKRGEDVRARLAVLSEMPAAWADTLHRWIKMNQHHRGAADGKPALSSADEVMLYQTILGAWPTQFDPADVTQRDALVHRIAGWQEKALREAKLHTSWAAPNSPYENAARTFLIGIMTDQAGFAADMIRMDQTIGAAGAVNGLSQALLKLTTPGVPDFYQGTEFWDQSLVDPDNRRAVDFDVRRSALESMNSLAALAVTWRDGRVKQAMIARMLRLRHHLPCLFARGDYLPLKATGERSKHLIAFVRRHAPATMVVIVPRLPLTLLGTDDSIQIPPSRWGDTMLEIALQSGTVIENILTDRSHTIDDGRLPVGGVLAEFPAAVLLSRDA